MGSQCCKSDGVQQEIDCTVAISHQQTPNPQQKASLSQQGSKKSQLQESDQQQEKPDNYVMESEIQEKQHHSHQESLEERDVVAQIEPQSPMKPAEVEANNSVVLPSKNSQQDLKTQSKKLRLGADVFVKLKEGIIGQYYTFGPVLGQGAFGKVWKVTHKTTGLQRAIKQIKKSSLIKEEEQRLFSEMNILKNLDHPHIVRLYELFQDEANYYLVTEYLSGGELFDRIKKMSTFSESIAADYIRQILLAVVHCHEQNIVHRDLKPENVIFISDDSHSQLKVIDFGTSRKFDHSKHMSKRLGTPYYIAPEVLNHQYNEKCDIWSCGVILYILLCGYPPFVGKTENQILERVKLGKFTFDPEDWEPISREAKEFVTRLLRMDPNKRPSAKQALEDPWLARFAPTTQINKKVLDNLRQFQAETILKQALMQYMVTQMSTQKEIADLEITFKILDIDNDGFLSKEELIQGYLRLNMANKAAQMEAERILKIADVNNSGKVDFSEFCVAAINQEKLLSVQRIQQAFKIFDQVSEHIIQNGDGYISKAELENVMGEVDDEIWQQILGDCDNNGDGRISYEEFVKMLRDKVH